MKKKKFLMSPQATYECPKKCQLIRSSRLAGQREHIYECLVLLYRKTLTKERKSVTYHFRVSNLQRYMFNHWPINNERNIISFLAEKYYFQALYFQQEKKDISFVDNQSAVVAETFHFMYE